MTKEITINRSVREQIVKQISSFAVDKELEQADVNTSITPEFLGMIMLAGSGEVRNPRVEKHIRRMAAAYLELVAQVRSKPKAEFDFWVNSIRFIEPELEELRSFDDLTDAKLPIKAAISDMFKLVPNPHVV